MSNLGVGAGAEAHGMTATMLRIGGIITSVDEAGGTVKMKADSGAEIELNIHNRSLIDSSGANNAGLVDGIGDRIGAVYDTSSATVIKLARATACSGVSAEGTATSGAMAIAQVPPTPGVAATVEASASAKVSGEFAFVDVLTGTVTRTTSGDGEVRLETSADTRITQDGESVKLAD